MATIASNRAHTAAPQASEYETHGDGSGLHVDGPGRFAGDPRLETHVPQAGPWGVSWVPRNPAPLREAVEPRLVRPPEAMALELAVRGIHAFAAHPRTQAVFEWAMTRTSAVAARAGAFAARFAGVTSTVRASAERIGDWHRANSAHHSILGPITEDHFWGRDR